MTGIIIPEDLLARAQALADRRGLTTTEFIVEALEEDVYRHEAAAQIDQDGPDLEDISWGSDEYGPVVQREPVTQEVADTMFALEQALGHLKPPSWPDSSDHMLSRVPLAWETDDIGAALRRLIPDEIQERMKQLAGKLAEIDAMMAALERPSRDLAEDLKAVFTGHYERLGGYPAHLECRFHPKCDYPGSSYCPCWPPS